jgi:hypothetical protein
MYLKLLEALTDYRPDGGNMVGIAKPEQNLRAFTIYHH